MTLTISFLSVGLLLSQWAFSSDLSVKVFITDKTPFQMDADENSEISLKIFNLDELTRAENRLTQLLKSKIPEDVKPQQVQRAYQSAFSDLLNSPEWNKVNQELMRSTEPQEMAMRLRIKKVPAVVFNEKYIVYGISSLKQAMDILNQRGLVNDDQ
jgi:integrating conjugative element protein (TIGR03757 family)